MVEFKTRTAVSPLKSKTFKVKSGQSLKSLKSAEVSVHFHSKDDGKRFITRKEQLTYRMKIIGRCSSCWKQSHIR